MGLIIKAETEILNGLSLKKEITSFKLKSRKNSEN